ncbi:MAG: DUF2062 domain-containing protein [Rikenellaceae bacterium]
MRDIKERIRESKILVVVPTYNNPLTLAQVVEGVREYSDDLLVVNDGSTDGETPQIIESLGVKNISYTPNKGKGYAIRQALRYAASSGYDYILTIDSDGQHYPSDIEKFVAAIEQTPNSLIVGSRNLRADNMPSKNTFANNFSNFWYHVETGQKLEDTQSGYRLYPIKNLAMKHYFSNRYEFEVEVIVRAAWRGIKVFNIPIRVYYPPAEERVSHFQPLKDFSRISVVNTFLFTLALLYYYPLCFIKGCNPANVVRLIKKHITATDESNSQIAAAIGLGVFLGIFPVWGYQMILAAGTAHLLKLNKAIALVSSNISIPPMIPFILYGSYLVGGVGLGSSRVIDFQNITLEAVYQDIWQYLIGAAVLAVVAGAATYVVSLLTLKLFRKRGANV